MLRVRVACALAGLVLAALLPIKLFAQTVPSGAVIQTPALSGACVVVILSASTWGQKLRIDGREATVAWERSVGDTVTIHLNDGLRVGDALSVNRSGFPEVWSDSVTVQPASTSASVPAPASCRSKSTPELPVDERDTFSATARVGSLAETFAPQADALTTAFNTGKSLETADATGSSTIKGRVMLDFDVQGQIHKLWGRPLWMRTRAFYGARQALICTKAESGDATAAKDGPCDDNGIPLASQALKIAKNANSAELYIGVRYEFFKLPDGSAPGSLYVTCGNGSLFILGVGTKALDHNHCGGGLILTRGRFRESYVEYSHGISEIFAPDESTWTRNRIDVFITFSFVGLDVSILKRSLKSTRPFFSVSLDRGKGPDSLVTTFGVGFDVARMFGGG